MKKEGKRGQTTIFIIAAIVIVAIVGVFFFFSGKNILPGSPQKGGEITPSQFFTTCLQEKIEEGTKIISSQGGYIEPEFYRTIDGENLSYLCYNENYYLSCINQEPMLLNHLDDELTDYIRPHVESCFSEFKTNLEEEGYNIVPRYDNFGLTLSPGKIVLDINAEISASRKGQSENIEIPQIFFRTKFYDNAVVAQEILSQEAEYCNFENIGFSLIYPEYSIEKFRMGDSTTIYTVINKKTQEEFKFLVRSCVIPPGI